MLIAPLNSAILVSMKITNVNKVITKKVGRPKGKSQDRLFQMRVKDDFIQSLDTWRRTQADLPSRSESVRRLVELGLKGKR